MAFTFPVLTALRVGEPDVQLCTCARYQQPHEPLYRATTRHVNEATGELGEQRAVFLCANAAAAIAYSYGLKFPPTSPDRTRPAPAKEKHS